MNIDGVSKPARQIVATCFRIAEYQAGIGHLCAVPLSPLRLFRRHPVVPQFNCETRRSLRNTDLGLAQFRSSTVTQPTDEDLAFLTAPAFF